MTTTTTSFRRVSSTGSLRHKLNPLGRGSRLLDGSRHRAVDILEDLKEHHEEDEDPTNSTTRSDSSNDEPTTRTTSSLKRRSAPSSQIRPLKSCLSVGGNLDSLEDKSWRSADDSPKPRMKKNVSFHKIEIREHPRALADHPSVSSGPAVGIDWFDPSKGHQEHSLTLQEYEQSKPQPRNRLEMVMPRRVREDLLREQVGLTTKEMNLAARDSNRIKAQRRATNALPESSHKSALRMEKAKRKVKRLLTKTSAQKEQELLWKKAQNYQPQHCCAIARSESLPTMVRFSTATEDETTTPTEAITPPPTPSMPTSQSMGNMYSEESDVAVDLETDDDDWAFGYDSD